MGKQGVAIGVLDIVISQRAAAPAERIVGHQENVKFFEVRLTRRATTLNLNRIEVLFQTGMSIDMSLCSYYHILEQQVSPTCLIRQIKYDWDSIHITKPKTN